MKRLMKRSSATAAIAAIAILVSPGSLLAQSTSSGSGSGAPNAGSSGTGTSGLSVPPRGTNSAGTAQSSGSGANTGAGVTTGAAGTGTMARPQADIDAAIGEENKAIDRRLKKGICRGC